MTDLIPLGVKSTHARGYYAPGHDPSFGIKSIGSVKVTDLIPLGVKSTLARGYALPGHAERCKDVVPKAGVGAPLDLQDKRSKGGTCTALLPSREGDRQEMCPGASGYQSSFSEDSRLHF